MFSAKCRYLVAQAPLRKSRWNKERNHHFYEKVYPRIVKWFCPVPWTHLEDQPLMTVC